jgi:hypothetical protein
MMNSPRKELLEGGQGMMSSHKMYSLKKDREWKFYKEGTL